jgi:HNH endonuclease
MRRMARYGYRYGRRYGRRGGNAGSGIVLLAIILAVVAAKHPGYAIAVAVPVAVVLCVYFGGRAYKRRKARRELAQAVEARRQYWREAEMVPGTFSVYLSSVKEADEGAVRSCLDNLALNPAVDIDPEHLLRLVHHHVHAQTVVSGVDEDIAIDLKEELEHWGGKVRIKEDAVVQVRHNGRREPIPERVRNEVWRRDGGQCVDCGSRERLEFDHIVPWSKGGANTARNLELRCEHCNRKKAAKI